MSTTTVAPEKVEIQAPTETWKGQNFQSAAVPGGNIKDYALAVGKVRYAGEAVVAVVAETRELARDASELVEVEYEPLDAVTDARHALDESKPVLHEDAGGSLMWSGLYEWGDLDAAF